jgi:hypothetical protein
MITRLPFNAYKHSNMFFSGNSGNHLLPKKPTSSDLLDWIYFLIHFGATITILLSSLEYVGTKEHK